MIKIIPQTSYWEIWKALACSILLLSVNSSSIKAQQEQQFLASKDFNAENRGKDRFRIVFYNVENLFDYINDSTTLDEEFLPRSGRYWTKERYLKKQASLAKTLIATGGWEPPELIGLCEIENRYVLNSLTGFTALKNVGYEIIHQDSKDRRGIDVAALYRPDKFKLIDYNYYAIKFPFDTTGRTRDILHVMGELPNKETLHFFVNHWPSKFGGEFETKPKRLFVAQFLKSKIDSVLNIEPDANIIVTGDLNDEPDAESIIEGLEVKTEISEIKRGELFNLMYPMMYLTGTHSFENRWSVIDHFIVNAKLLDSESKVSINNLSAQIFDMPFLIIEGATGATRPFRIYQGPKYIGGYSDHLPILLDLLLK